MSQEYDGEKLDQSINHSEEEKTTLKPNHWPMLQGATKKPPSDDVPAALEAETGKKRQGDVDHDRIQFPIKNWADYQPLAFLGQGGMGQVFKAYDPRLKRNVAVKFLKIHHPESRQRFLTEARAQARIDHPAVCKVYDVGEKDGYDYIVMAFVAGKPLSEMGRAFSYEETALIIRQAAEGLQAAHVLGLLHRDVKPGNLMVSRTPTGELKVHLVDFGLALELDATRLTQTGQVLGTPAFMAPEQAAGDLQKSDRRNDIYGLGATLYFLLTGRPPFTGTTAVILHDVQYKDPVPPRKRQPDIPADLETIAMRCLEKEIQRRYQSAHQLAADLSRYLAGQSIQARPVTALERLSKLIRRNPWVTSAFLTAFLVILCSLGWTVHARYQEEQRRAWVLAFSTRAQDLEDLSRYAHLARRHDIQPTLNEIQAQMTHMMRDMARLGPLAQGPGHYALGSGYLALGDHDRARTHLETAWDEGFQEGRVATALALALGGQYQAETYRIRRVRDAAERDKLMAKAEADLLARARQWGDLSQTKDSRHGRYIAAYLDFLYRRDEAALVKAQELQRQSPWMVEAFQLEGDVFHNQALEAGLEGDRERAMLGYDQAMRAYEEAARVGASDPAVYLGRARLAFLFFYYESHGSGQVQAYQTATLEALESLMEVVPDSLSARQIKANLWYQTAILRKGTEADVLGALAQARTTAEQGLAAHPNDGDLLLVLGMIHWEMGRTSSVKDDAYWEHLHQAVDILAHVPPGLRTSVYHADLGYIYLTLGQDLPTNNQDGVPYLKRAVANFEASLARNPNQLSALINLGRTLNMLAAHEAPNEHLERARNTLNKALALNPRHIGTLFYLSRIHRTEADLHHQVGVDPRADMERGLTYLERALAINPNHATLHKQMGVMFFSQAKYAWDLGEDPAPWLERAITSHRLAVELTPKDGYAWLNLSGALVRKARLRLLAGLDPENATDQAEAALDRGLSLLPDLPLQAREKSHLLLVSAMERHRRGGDPGPLLVRARDHLAAYLSGEPQAMSVPIGLTYAQTLLLEAEHAVSLGAASPPTVSQAITLLEPLKPTPKDQIEYWITMGKLLLFEAESLKKAGRPSQATLETGLELMAQALQHNPNQAEIRCIYAALLYAASPNQVDRRKARAHLSRALEHNPNLAFAWGKSLD